MAVSLAPELSYKYELRLYPLLVEFCSKGFYCAQAGTTPICCEDGTSLAECGASITVATLAPSAASTSSVSSSSPAAASTSAATIPHISYANTTFTKTSGQTTAAASTTVAAGTTAEGTSSPAGPEFSTAFSTTTIPLAGGGFTTATEFTVPEATATSPGTVQASGSMKLSISFAFYQLGWLALTGFGALLLM
jgi:hypothetical protein